LIFSVRFWGNDAFNAFGLEDVDETLIGIESLVGKQRLGGDPGQESI
jgi:hypothetical protein